MNEHSLNKPGSGENSIKAPLAITNLQPDINVVIGTKAQYIKTAPLLRELTRRRIEYRLVDTGQHAALSSKLRGELGVKEPDVCLGDSSNVKTVAQAARWAARILAMTAFRSSYLRHIVFRPGPGYCVIHGDTPSTLLALLMAKRAGKTVVHLEAGLRSFNLLRPFPEELIRILCMYFSDVLFAPSKWARQNLRSMGVRGHCIELSQNTNVEAMYFALQHGDRSLVPAEPYALMTVHRVETILSRRRLRQIVELACELARDRLVLFVLHDPTINKLRDFGMLQDLEQCRGLRTTPLLMHSQFLPLVAAADFVVTDGGSIQEEAYYLDVPCIVVRSETERMEGVGSNVHVVGFDLEAIRTLVRQFGARPDRFPVENREPSHEIANVLLDGNFLCTAHGETRRPWIGT